MHTARVPAKVLDSLRLARIKNGERIEHYTIQPGEDGLLYLRTNTVRLFGIGLLGFLGILFGLFMAGCLVYALLIGQTVKAQATVVVVLPLLFGAGAVYFSVGVTQVCLDPQAGEIDCRWLYGLLEGRRAVAALSAVVFRIWVDGNFQFCKIEFRGDEAPTFSVGTGTNVLHEKEAVTMAQVACWAARELKLPLVIESDRDPEDAFEEDVPLGKYLRRLLPE